MPHGRLPGAHLPAPLEDLGLLPSQLLANGRWPVAPMPRRAVLCLLRVLRHQAALEGQVAVARLVAPGPRPSDHPSLGLWCGAGAASKASKDSLAKASGKMATTSVFACQKLLKI